MRILISLIALPTLLFAGGKLSPKVQRENVAYEPWFTGPLLAPTPVNMVPGHPAVEPIIGFICTYGNYNSNGKIETISPIWSINPSVDFQIGFTKNTGLEIIASYETNFQKGNTSSQFQDLLLLFGYQLSTDKKNSWVPDCRLHIDLTVPTGRHDQLTPSLEGIDVSGQGAYFIGADITCQKLIYLPENFLYLHWSVGYLFPMKAPLHNQSFYGGGSGTRGEIRPGQILSLFFSFEYSFNQNWVFAMDTFALYQTKASRFKGKPGFNENGEPFEIGRPSSLQISVTPSMEYNFTGKIGLIFGVWATLAGFNNEAFASLFLAYVHIF